MSIRYKIIILLFCILVSTIVLITYSTHRIEQALIDRSYRDTQILADNFMFFINSHIRNYQESINRIASNPDIALFAEHQASEQSRLSPADLEKLIASKSGEWKMEHSNLYNIVANSPVSKNLFYTFIDYPRQTKGQNIISEIFITDKYAEVIASSDKIQEYCHVKQEWWLSTREKGEYISDIYFDQSSSYYSILISKAIMNKDKEFQGEVTAIIPLENIFNEVDFFNPDSTWSKILIINENGKTYYDNEIFNVSNLDLFKALKKDKMYEDSSNNIYIKSNVPLYENSGWFLLMEYSKDKLMSDIPRTAQQIDILYLVVASILASIVFLFTIRITKIIKALKKTAKEIENGALTDKASLSLNEIGELSTPIKKILSALTEKESDLKRTEQTLRAFTESDQSWEYWVEKDYKTIAYCSASSENITGFKREDFYSDSSLIYKMVHHEDKIHFNESNTDINDPSQQERYFRIITRAGGIKWISQTSKPLFNAENEMIGRLFYNTDATELQKIKNELLEYAVRLKLSNKELEQFAYIISHDLQEPLRKVISFGNLLEDEYKNKLDSTASSYIQIMKSASMRMRELINGILAYSRIGTSNNPVEHVDMNSILKNVIEDMEISIKEKDAVLEIEPLISSFRADPIQIKQLFMNLISNSLKYSRQGIPPRISIKMAHDNDKSFAIAIQDNGIGIDSKYHERVFLPFQRLHTSQEYPGTGIGLSLCKKIVEKHNGRIEIKNAPEQGTVFLITFMKKRQDEFDA